MASHANRLSITLREGDPLKVSALLEAGADIRYKREDGYDALLDAVHGRGMLRDPRLLDLLKLLVASGAELSGVSSYQESGLRVLSHVGRFDAVQLLLEAGADASHLQWTPLIKAVALGAVSEVEKLVEGGAALEETDW
jgi:ankyrin repeat protein